MAGLVVGIWLLYFLLKALRSFYNRRTFFRGVGLAFFKLFTFVLLTRWLSHLPAPIVWLLAAVWLLPYSFLLLLVQFRSWQLVYYATRLLQPFLFVGDHGAGACFLALRCMRGQAPDSLALRRIQDKLDRLPSINATGLAALGLAAAINNDRQQARAFFEIINDLPAHGCGRVPASFARDWLIVDRLHDEDWYRVARLGLPFTRRFRWSELIGMCAERQIVELDGSSSKTLWSMWLFAPRHLHTLPILRRALAARPKRSAGLFDLSEPTEPPPVGQPQEPSTPPTPKKDALQRWSEALGVLSSITETSRVPSAQALAEAVDSVQHVLDSPEFSIAIEQRALALGANQSGDALVARLRSQLVERLQAPIERLGAQHEPIRSESPLLREAVAIVRERWVGDFEACVTDYAARGDRMAKPLPAAHEWSRWVHFTALAERLRVLDPNVGWSVFEPAFPPLCNFAANQFNHAKRPTFAYCMFRWLSTNSAGSSDNVKICDENCEIVLH